MDYQFLLGQQFLSRNRLFTVSGLTRLGDRTVVKGVCAQQAKSFPAEYVLQSLVTEEIELLQTGGIIS